MASKSREENIIDDIANNDKAINADLYKAYSENLRKGVGSVFTEDNGSGLSDQLRANVSRFAAYKAYHATQQVKEWMTETGSIDDAKKVLHKFNRYQAAEYNTTVARCRTAKQWQEFDQPENRRLFPNIVWLPSRSVTLRDEHVKFYNRVWTKDDPFWDKNQPGNLWNCKCDWEETDDAVTDGNPTRNINANGLDGNPGTTGEVFTDNCSYVKHAGKNRKERDKTECRCQGLERSNLQKNAKTHSALNESFQCDINGNEQQIKFADWGIKEMAQSMFGDKNFWIKNEILNTPNSLDKPIYIKSANVDLSHNTGKTLRLKKHFIQYHYIKTALPNGKEVYLNIVEHDDGNYYLYTVTKNLPKY